jgi:hypothetical protein
VLGRVVWTHPFLTSTSLIGVGIAPLSLTPFGGGLCPPDTNQCGGMPLVGVIHNTPPSFLRPYTLPMLECYGSVLGASRHQCNKLGEEMMARQVISHPLLCSYSDTWIGELYMHRRAHTFTTLPLIRALLTFHWSVPFKLALHYQNHTWAYIPTLYSTCDLFISPLYSQLILHYQSVCGFAFPLPFYFLSYYYVRSAMYLFRC